MAQTIARQDISRLRDSNYSLSQYLMPYSYLADEQSYVMADGSVAKVLECTPAPCSSKSDAELKGIADLVSLSLSRFTQDTLIQIFVAPTTDITDDLDSYVRNGGTRHHIVGGIEARKVEFFKTTREKPMFHWRQGGGSFLTKRFRVVVVITVAPDQALGGVGASFKDAFRSSIDQFKSWITKTKTVRIEQTQTEKRFMEMRDALIGRLNTQVSGFMSNLNSRDVQTKVMPVGQFIAMCRSMLYPASGIQDSVAYDPDMPLSHQIPLSEVTVDFQRGDLEAGGAYHRVASLARVPPFTYPGYLSMPNRDLNGLTLLDYLTDGFICLSATTLPKQEVRTYLERRERFVRGGFAMKEKAPYLLEDCAMASRWVEVENRNVFFGQMIVSMWDRDPEKARLKLEHLREKFGQVRLDLRVEQEAGPSLFLQSLPMNFAPNIKEARRMFWIPDQGIADLMPIYGMGRGTTNARFLAHNRAGEPVRFNLFDSNTSPHFVTIGASGSGKSFFVNSLAADFIRKDKAQVIFIDKGRSYATLTTVLGEDGSFNNLGLKTRTCINPCAGTLGETSGFLISLIKHLVTQAESEALRSEEVGILSVCVTEAFARKQQPKPYSTYRQAKKDYPKSWFHRLMKRFACHRMDDMTMTAVEQAKNQSGDRTPEYRAFYVATLHGRRDQTNWKKLEDVPEEALSWFTSRQLVLIDKLYNLNGVSVLYPATTIEAAMESDGYSFTVNRELMVLEVARETDLAAAIDAGVELHLPADFIAHHRKSIEHYLRNEPRYQNATEASIREYVDAKVREVDSTLLFEWAPGEMVVQREVYLSDIGRELEGYGNAAATSIATRLSAYHSKGTYAAFFDGPTGFDLHHKKIICFELEELASAGDHLLAAVVGSLLQMVILYGQEDEVRPHQKMLVLEEFWQLLKVPMIADQVLNLYRTARKFNTAVGCVSQLITDFTGPPDSSAPQFTAGRSIMDAATTRFLLTQPPSVTKIVDRLLKYTEEQKYLLMSVASSKGVYSEILYDCTDNGKCDVMRLVSNPFFYWVATSDGADNKLREQKIREFNTEGKSSQESVRLALDYCSTRYPNGVAAGAR